MPTHYPLRFATQLRQHLKAFRKARKLTQAQLGDLVGVSQARIAEIEANPGLVRFEQLMQLLSALDVTISLSEDLSTWQAPEPARNAKRYARKTTGARYAIAENATWKDVIGGTLPPNRSVDIPSWKIPTLGMYERAPTRTSVPDQKPKKSAPVPENAPSLKPDSDVQPSSKRNFIVRPKKGTW